jgi:hypothetical protein
VFCAQTYVAGCEYGHLLGFLGWLARHITRSTPETTYQTSCMCRVRFALCSHNILPRPHISKYSFHIVVMIEVARRRPEVASILCRCWSRSLAHSWHIRPWKSWHQPMVFWSEISQWNAKRYFVGSSSVARNQASRPLTSRWIRYDHVT